MENGVDDARVLGGDHPLIAWSAFLAFRNGDTARGLALALTVRDQPLVLDAADAAGVGDQVISRLWLSRVEQRADPEAHRAARELLDADHPVGPYRRALLHYGLALSLVAHTDDPTLADLDEVTEHVNRGLALARSLEIPSLVARCLSLLALLQVPYGDPAAAEALSREALTYDDQPAGAPAFWRLRATLTLQWARHLQGLPIDRDLVRAAAARPLLRSDPVLTALHATVVALDELGSGNVGTARRTLAQALVDRRIRGTGVWQLPLLVLEAFLAVAQYDARQAARSLTALEALPAPAEAAVVRAINLSQQSQQRDALRVLVPVTGGAVPCTALTFTSACTVEAALLDELGRDAEADRSMARALGAAEPINALRLFADLGPGRLPGLARRAAAAAPQNQWAATVATYLETARGHPSYGSPGPSAAEPVPWTRPTSDGAGPGVSPLTPRELEVLALVNDGATQARIAATLFITVNTTKSHLSSIRRKLAVARTAEAAAIARQAGWL